MVEPRGVRFEHTEHRDIGALVDMVALARGSHEGTSFGPRLRVVNDRVALRLSEVCGCPFCGVVFRP